MVYMLKYKKQEYKKIQTVLVRMPMVIDLPAELKTIPESNNNMHQIEKKH